MSRRAPAATQRFLDHIRWARAIARRWMRVEDVEQAALIGLFLADAAMPAELPESDFRRYAVTRVRGEVLDHLRRVAHGGRRQGRTALRPRAPEPGSVAMAQELGLVSQAAGLGECFARGPDPESYMLAREDEQACWAAIGAAGLSDRQRIVLERRLHGDRATDIASDLGVTQARVSQLVSEAVEKIHAAR